MNCPRGYPIPELLNKRVILELDGLSDSDQAFIIGSLLLWIYHYRLRQPEREILKHFIVIEEAHHLFLETRKEEDIADIIMREIRELGEAIIVIDQHPSKMSVSALGNLSTKFALTLSLNQDVMAIANAMLLGKDERRYLSMLTLGQCICRSDRFSLPVLLTIDNFPIQKGTVTDEDLKTLMAGYLKDLTPENPRIFQTEPDSQYSESGNTIPPGPDHPGEYRAQTLHWVCETLQGPGAQDPRWVQGHRGTDRHETDHPPDD